MLLDDRHIQALQGAESLMFHSDFCPYLELKELLSDASVEARSRFRTLFSRFYGMNVGGLTDEFKDRYFEILFAGGGLSHGEVDFAAMLKELGAIPGLKGHAAIPYSFVSKLVAMHRDSSPIYDRHVRTFFGKTAPAPSKPIDYRIKWYLDFLQEVAATYEAAARDARVAATLKRLKARDRRLAQCHVVRLMDFLVWKVGNQGLLRLS